MNKVYKVIWNTLLGIWVVASELAKGKQKSSSQGQGSRAQRKTAKRLANAFMLVGLFAAQPVFAADACEVGTAKELGAALNNNDCTDITLTADINLADYRDGALYSGASNVPGGTGLNNNTTKFDFGTRTAITLDGGAAKYGISNGNNQAYRFAVRGGDADNQVTFTIKNANLTTTAAANNANHFFASVGDSGSNVNVIFDNIQGIPNSTLALMTYGSGANDGVAYRRTSTSYSTSSSGNTLNGYDANYKRGYTYNQNIYSKVTVGTFLGNNASNPFNSVTYKQWINGSKIDFTGTLDFYGTGANNAYSYVFWNNTNDLLQNQLTFKTGSDVSFNLDANTKLTTGDGNGQGYSYAFEDGSSFKLWSKQNVFGSVTGNNVGLEIGSYNKDTKEFGSGAKIIYAGVNGAQLAGDGITNLGGKNYRISNSLYTHSIINNGQYNAGDIIFNLAEGSQFNVTGIGINVLKSQYLNDDLDKATTNINNSGIYIRSATNIDAATGMNIVHDGNGEVVIKNTGALTTTTSGITISSASGNNMNVDMSKGATDSNSGVINATSGTGITAGSSATDKVVLNLTGGEINTSGTASAVTLSNPTNTATHTLNDLIVNLGGSGNMLAKADAVKVALSNVVLNINNRVGLNNLAGINFLSSEKGSNTINVGGTGTGIETTNTAISNLNSEALQINVNGAGVGVATTGGGVDLTDPGLNITVNSPDGTALTIADGGSNTTTIGSNVALNATGATAIKFSGDAAKTFVNQGTVKGTVDFTGDKAHTLTNNGILDGALTAGNGNNSLVLGEGSQSLGTLTFGNGNNNVTINNGALVKSISTGSGNDTFTLNDLTGSNTYLGTIDAGTGTNTLNMNRSQSALQTDTALRGFTNINLSENTDLTLTSQNNITGGTVLLDNSSKLQFGNGYNGNFSATLGHVSDGDGSIIVNNGAAVTLANSGINAFTGGWSVNNGASLTATRGDQIANSSGFALSGVLNLNGLTSLNNALTGAGTLNINAVNQAFNFGSTTGNAFTGNVSLKDTALALSGTNTAALQRATLTSGSGSVVTVGASDQTIGNMTLNGGTTAFDTGNINTSTLSVAQQSAVQVNADGILEGNLLDQDESSTRKIINSTNTLTAGQLALLTLQNAQGDALGNGTQLAISQNGDEVANGTYNYALSGSGGGLTVTAQLIKLALAANRTLVLDTENAAKQFGAQITGSGNLELNAGTGALTLSSQTNNYTGNTAINSGTVVAGENNALGATTGLGTKSGATFNLNGKSQTIDGALANAGQIIVGNSGSLTSGILSNTGVVNIGGGMLTLNNGGSSSAAGGLTGNGNLVVSGGELAVSEANAGLAGNTTINQGAAVTLTDTGTLGSAAVGIASGGTLNLNADQTLANVLSGGGAINTGGKVILSADNTFSGTHTIGKGAELTISKSANLGSEAATVNLSDADSQFVLNGLSGAIRNVLSGTVGSTVTLNNAGNATLAGNNVNFRGIYAVNENSTLTIGEANNLGASNASVLLGGTGNALNLARYGGVFNHKVNGTGTLSLTDTSNVTLNNADLLAAGVGINIGDNSELSLVNLNTFNQALSGDGVLNINNNKQSFNFGVDTGSAYAGTVNLTNVLFGLSGNNATALTDSTLNVGDGSTLSVGAGTQTIGNMTLASGTTVFSSGNIATDNLDITDNSVIQVTPGEVMPGNLLDQDEEISRKLINSSNSLSSQELARLTLQNAQGEALGNGALIAITQNDDTVAQGTYNYDLSGIGGGLSVTAQLVKLALATGKTLALDTAGATSKNFSALITGAGNLALNAGSDTLTLNNAGNDYTGSTTINSGTVVAGSNNALGKTSLLSTLAGTAFNLNGKSQTLGGLSNAGQITTGQNGALTSGALANTGTMNIAGGTLTLTNGGSSSAAGGLTGNGNLVVSGGELAVSKANAGLAGNTTINQGAAVTLTDTGTLGSAAVGVSSGGTLNLNADQTLANVLSGAGAIITGGKVTLSADNTFSGSHSVGADGALTISKAGNLGSDAATVSLSSAGSQLVLNALSGAINNALSGVAGSSVSLSGGSEAALGGNNSNFLGTYSVGDDSTLSVGSASNLGAGSASVLLGGAGNTLNLAGYSGAFGNQVGGAGLLSLSDSADVTLNSSGNLASDIGIDIAGGSALTLAGLNAFNQALTGGGALNINGSTGFTFGSNTGGAFAGRVNLSNSQFGLTGNNTASLKSATLDVGGGASVIVGAGAQTVGNLTLDGGITQFTDGSSITSGTLAVAQNSTIRVTPDDVTTGNLLDQDDGTQRRLIGSSNTLSAEDLAKLTLQDAQGQAIKTGVEVAIDQGVGTAATGTYNYDLSGIGGGLSVTAQLVKLALATGKTLALDTAGATSKNFSALITGAGNLALNAGSDTLTLNNAGNDYTGSTTINSGTVVAGSNNALGKTSLLSTLAGTAFNLNGKSQTLGGLANTGTVNIAGGTLTLTNGGSSSAAGGLTGNGSLVVSGGELAVSKANAGLAGNTAIGSGGTITLSDSGTLGSAAVGVASGGTLNLNADQTLANVLSGGGNINTGANVTLSADNTFSGSHTVGADGTLTISKAGNLGSEAATVSLSSAGSQLVLNALSGAINNALSGVAGSTVSLSGGSEAALGGNNSNFLGTYSVGGDSTLSVGSVNNLGAGSASVLLGGAGNTLNLAGYRGAFGNQVGGAGLLSLSDSADVTLNSTGNLASDIGVDIADGSALTLAGLNVFNQALTGSGALNVNAATGNPAFNFGDNTGNNFAGQVNLSNAQLMLSGNNTASLKSATLDVGGGASVIVGAGAQAVGNLTLDGGTTQFTDGSSITSGTLAVAQNSTIRVTPDDVTTGNLLDQDDGTQRRLIGSSNTLSAEDLAKLTLQDAQGQAIKTGVEVAIDQGDGTAATGTYNYDLSGIGGGLSVTAQLVKLALATGKTLALDTAGATSKNFSALITGAGNLALNAGSDTLTLNNTGNDYTGSTTINSGTVAAGSNNALGKTSLLSTLAGTAFNLNGKSQTLGGLSNAGQITTGQNGALTSGALANTGTVNIAGGTLTLTNGGSSSAAGGLTGNGSLVVSGGELAVSKANAGLAGNTAIGSGGTITLSDSGTLGSAAVGVASGGTLNLNADQTLANVLSGAGAINTGGKVTLSADNTFSGSHSVGADGALTISKAGNLGSEAATVSLSSAGSQLVLNALSGAVNNALSGVAGSTVSLTGGSEAALGGNNSNFLGTYSVGGDSTLSVGSASNLGAGSASVLLGGAGNTLNLAGYSGAFGNQVGGTGLLSLSDSADVTLNSTGNLASDIGVDIADGSALTLAGLTDFNQLLSGSGAFIVDGNDQSFNFGAGTGSAFSGNIMLNDVTFDIANNSGVLGNATLTLNTGSLSDVGESDTTVGNLNLNGGELAFSVVGPQSAADGTIKTDNLALNIGTIAVNGGNSWENYGPDDLKLMPILAQDYGNVLMTLVDADTLTGKLKDIALKINDVLVVTHDQRISETITQDGETAATAYYNFGLSDSSVADDPGLYVKFSMVGLDLISDGDKGLLIKVEDNRSDLQELRSLLSGSGGLVIEGGDYGLTISNSDNSYSGTTILKNGQLILGDNNVLGNTSQLEVYQGASTLLNGHSQTVETLANSGTVDITDGTLTLTNGGSSSAAGGLTGNGNLVVSGGELAVSKANAALAGNTTINQGAAVTLTNTGTLGSAAVGVASGGTLNLNADQTLANVLSGGGNINTGANVTLSADNTFSGSHHVGADGTLTISKAGNLGSDAATVSLSSADSQLVLNALSGAINNALSGVAGSTVSLSGGSEAALGGNNSNFLGTYSVGGDSTLSVGSASNLGADSASVLLGGAGNTLNLAGYSGAFGNQVGGTGLLSLSDSADVTLNSTGNLASDIGVDIADGSALTLAGLNVFNQALTGSGALNVNAATGNQAFNFGDNTGNNFAGQVNLSNAQFMLSGNNTLALTDANLNVGGGTTVSVDVDPQAIGGLTLGGGTTRFTSDGYIESGSLDVTDSSIIQVQNNLSLGDNLLEQSNGESRVLVNSKALSAEELAKLSLQDLDGNSLTNNTEVGVIQSGATVAEGFYNFALSADSGLSVVARLVKLALLADKTLELNTDNTSEAAKTFTAQITGNGNLALNANSESLTLSNTENDYTGSTLIKSGTLVAGSNNALGNTSQLSALANTLFDLNGKSQSLGALINAGTIKVGADGALTINKDDTTGKTGEFNNTGVVDIGDGTLTLNNGGASTVAGGLTGNGNLVVSGGELAISQANAGLAGTTLIDEAGTLTLSDSGTLGNAEVAVDGMLNLNVNQTLVNVLRGTGDINTNGNVTLSAESSFKGTHRINSNGMLTISQAANLGSSEANVALQDASSALVFDALNGELGQSLSGVSGSQINVTKGSGAILTGDNDAFKGTYNVSGESSLTASFTSQLGEEASVSLEAAGDALNLSEYRGDFANQVAGKGTISLTEGSLVAMNSMANIGSDIAMSIDNNSELQLSDVAEFNQALSGNGSLNVNAGNQTFNFGANTGGAFTGSVTLQDSTFNLNQNNVTAVANAALTLGRDSITNVGSTDRSLKDIDVNGGKLAFEVDAPQSKANGIINAETLALNSGDVAVTGDAEWENVGVPAAPGVSILDQDRGEVLMTLVNAGAVTGNVNNINLSINGTPVISGDQAVLSAITQGDKTVANATYSYGLTSNNGDDTGLYIKYGLTALELVTDGTDALLLETGEAGSNQSLNALLSGKGGLNINASNGALTLANGKNSYTGVTTVNQGALLLGADNALGQTSELTIKQGATTSLNGFKQTVGVLNNSGTVSLDNGELVLSNGGQSGSDDGLKGEGAITVAGGDLSISGANDNLKGNTSINSGASITLSDNGNLGSSKVDVDGALNLNAAGLTLGNALSGDGRVNVNAATTLNGNSTFTGEHHVSGDGSLTITQSNNLGADKAGVNLDESGASLVMNGLSGAIRNALSGVQDSVVALTNSANVQLTGNNDGFTGSYALNGNSALTVGSLSQLGKNASISLAGAFDKLVLSGYQGVFSNKVAGNGVLTLADEANVTFGVGYQLDKAVGVNINRNSALTLSGLNRFDHALAGNGALNVTSGGPLFSFGEAAGTAFAGKVDLSGTGLILGNSNTLALTNANLTLSENGLVNVSDGVQKVGGLTLNNGTLKFDNIIDNNGQFVSEGVIEAGSIDVTGGGEVQVNLPANVTPGLEGKSLLELDEGEIIVDLARGDAKGSGQELTLTDANGQPITQSVQAGLTNDGASAPSAVGSFDYGLTTGTRQDGLYVNYGLKAIDLLAKGVDALRLQALEANNALQSNGMSAKISGSGDLAIEGLTDGAILSLSNGNNDYTGATLLRQGGLRLEASNALGLTSELAMSGGTQVDINGTRQTIGQLNAQADSRFNLNGGNVTIKNGGQVDGLLTGAGQLSLSAGTLNVSQANRSFTGNTAISSAASVVLADVTGLGSGNIANKGTLTLNGAQGTFANSLSEAGNLQLQNKATVQLSGNNAQYTGAFTLAGDTTLAANKAEQLGAGRVSNDGKLILDVANDWSLKNLIGGSGELIKQGSGTLKLLENVVTAGNTIIENGIIQLGEGTVKNQDGQTIYVADTRARARNTQVPVVLNSNVTIQENGALGGFGRVSGNVDNAGRLIMSHALTGDNYADFTVNGNYVGQKGSRIIFDTVLAGDESTTDRLVINGDTSGVSSIKVNNIGGQGAYTNNGIRIIDISGKSGANFELEGRVVAGAYDYKLYQGGVTNPSDGDWYLRTENPDRPEAGSYIANLAAANTMFNTSLENRSGETWYTDAMTGEKKATSMWLRTTGSHNRSRDSSGTFKTQDNRFVTQLGGDVFRFSSNENDLWRVGLMTGYANSSNNTITSGSGSRSKGSAKGYSVGTYGTWFADEKAHTGAYVDSWLQYSWFKNEVNGEGLAQEKYDSKGFTASLETGYTFFAGASEHYNFYLQPKAQAIWMGVKADDHREASNTLVSGEGDGNVQTRLGMKAFLTQPSQQEEAQSQKFKPYIEATWIHNSKDFAAKMSHETTGSHTFKQGGAGNVAEMKLGLEGDLTNRLNMWGNVGQQVGSKGYSDTTVTFGVKYNF